MAADFLQVKKQPPQQAPGLRPCGVKKISVLFLPGASRSCQSEKTLWYRLGNYKVFQIKNGFIRSKPDQKYCLPLGYRSTVQHFSTHDHEDLAMALPPVTAYRPDPGLWNVMLWYC